VHINADLRRFVDFELRQRSYANSGSSRPLELAFDY